MNHPPLSEGSDLELMGPRFRSAQLSYSHKLSLVNIFFMVINHQTFQVPKMEESSPSFSCMDTAYVREIPPPK